MDYKTIGANIKRERKRRGLTQEQLAEKAWISANFLACIETGIKKGSFETYVSIANLLDTTLDNLTNGVVNACTEDPLKDELNYCFDKADRAARKLIVKIAKVICEESGAESGE